MTAADRRPRVLFVCKATVHDGMGHVTRSRAVAAATAKLADVELVAIGGSSARNLLADSTVPHRVVADPAEAAAVARVFAPDVVVFDLLHLGDDEFEAIAGTARTVSLSPIFDRLRRVDVVFHRTSVADPAWEDLEGGPELRMGLEYAVLSEHCHRIPSAMYRETLARERLSVAVSLGGADAANKTLEVVKTLRENARPLLLWVLLGEGYAHSYQDLVDASRGARHEIVLAKTNDSMWHILGTCALAVLAGGTTTYQAAYAGLPSLNALESADRRFLVQELEDAGVCRCIGSDMAEALEGLNAAVEHLDTHRDELQEMHRRSQGLLDGRGAERIAREIVELAD